MEVELEFPFVDTKEYVYCPNEEIKEYLATHLPSQEEVE